MPEVDMKNEKNQNMPQYWSTESRRSLLMILLQKWQNDMMVIVMVMVVVVVVVVVVMIANCMGQHIHEV